MFDDLFDFAKKRTLRQSVGFFIVHGTIALAVVTAFQVLGS